MRRLIVEDKYSGAARAALRLAILAAAVAVLGIIASRRGLEPRSTLAVLGGALVLACGAALSAIAAYATIWVTGRKGAGRASAGLLFALAVLAYPAALAERAQRSPPLDDVSTDLTDPPAFSLSRRALEARDRATPESLPASARELQARAYPKILPILIDLDGPEAFAAVEKAIRAAGWRIVETELPGRRSRQGHIDAIAKSFFLGLPYDITVRLRPLVGQTRIDLRSVTRAHAFGLSDNPRNIDVFEKALAAELNRAKQ
jgi:plasmid stabilization system protein ParE